MNTKIESAFRMGLWMQSKKLPALRAGVLVLWLAAANCPAQTYSVLKDLTGWPVAGLALSGSTLYGTTEGGGAGFGTVFKINTDGSGLSWLVDFSPSSTGRGQWWPLARVVVSDGTVYGTTGGGGNGNSVWWDRFGGVFKVNTDGGYYKELRSFNGGDAAYPHGGLVLSGTTLYGTTQYGPVTTNLGTVHFGSGRVFKINTDGSGFAVLKTFGYDTLCYQPVGGLVLSGAMLYGTADGAIFKLNTDGTGFAVLKTMSRLNGDLVLSGTMLYGTDDSVVFKIGTDGTGFTVIRNCFGSDGTTLRAGLCLSGSTLYGTTSRGGLFGAGTVFQVEVDGSGFAVLKNFAGNDGSNSVAPLVMSGSALYGTTQFGGSLNQGVVFQLSLPPPTLSSPLQSQTAEAGTTVDWAASATGTPFLKYQWFFNDSSAISGVSTNSHLWLTNVQPSHSGVYAVLITNAVGAMTSPPAMLNVIPPVERRMVADINLRGEAGSSLHLDYTDTLGPMANWLPLDIVSLTSTSQLYFDVSLPGSPQRFYRAWRSGMPGVPPTLKPRGMVPAITLTGNIGNAVRLDCINQFGPTDAWVTLDTVTLTNTSQLYLDVSARGQPERLYRLVQVP